MLWGDTIWTQTDRQTHKLSVTPCKTVTGARLRVVVKASKKDNVGVIFMCTHEMAPLTVACIFCVIIFTDAF